MQNLEEINERFTDTNLLNKNIDAYFGIYELQIHTSP